MKWTKWWKISGRQKMLVWLAVSASIIGGALYAQQTGAGAGGSNGGNTTGTNGTIASAATSGAAYTNATTGFTTVVGGSGETLQSTVAANARFSATCQIMWQGSAATAGPQFQWTGPAAPTAVAASLTSPVTSTTFVQAPATAFSSAMADAGAVSPTTNFVAIVTLGLINGANAGTVTLQAAASGIGTLTIQPGSYCNFATGF